MRVIVSLLMVVLIPAACLPGAMPLEPGSPSAEECPAALLEGELVSDDGSGFLVRHAEGFVTPVIWPDGYTFRDGEVRELVDPHGQVVAREGNHVSLGGGMTIDDQAFVVCGPFTVTPTR